MLLRYKIAKKINNVIKILCIKNRKIVQALKSAMILFSN